jgi:hypothetical protein
MIYMGENGLSASDVALMNRDGGFGEGWGGMIWLFAILAMFGGGGFGWGGNNAQVATRDQVQNGFDTQNLQAQTRDILAAVNAASMAGVQATNQVYHDVVTYVGDKYGELQRDVAGLAVGQANLLANQNQCFGGLSRQIAQNNYDAAMRDAATNANIVAQNQKILDAIMGNKMEAMQQRINSLELQNALAGVVRYPNGWTYNAGNSPFCGGCNM